MEFKILNHITILSLNGDIHRYRRMDDSCQKWQYTCADKDGIFTKEVDLGTVGYSILDAYAHDAKLDKNYDTDGHINSITFTCRE